jgi:hypothetical protein
MQTQEMSNHDRLAAQSLFGRRVVDKDGQIIGVMNGFWLDPSTLRVAYMGVEISSFPRRSHVVPAAGCKVKDTGVVHLCFPAETVKESPIVQAGSELSQIEMEEINSHYRRIAARYRKTAIEEVRPEESIRDRAGSLPEGPSNNDDDRSGIERREQSFFNQKGFVTDAMPEVDASKDLEQAAETAKRSAERES